MTPLALVIAALAKMASSANAEVGEAYQQANREYRDAYFSYLNVKTDVAEKLQVHREAQAALPRAQAAVEEKERVVVDLQRQVVRAKNLLENATENMEVLRSQQRTAEERAREELDAPDSSDLIEQLNRQEARYKKTIASYTSDIEVEKRKIARVKRSPDYNFYVREIDLRKKRLERLQREEGSANEDLRLIREELSRLTDQQRIHKSRLDEALRILPSLAEELERANRELDAAQQSGDEFRIQIAESNFDQAHANHRRFEVQRNEAERGVLETTAQIEKKTKLADEKERLLALIVVEKEQARSEWEQLFADWQDYHKRHLKGLEDRLAELKGLKTKAEEKVTRLNHLRQQVIDVRAAIVEHEQRLQELAANVTALEERVGSAQAEVAEAQAAVGVARQRVQTTREAYNQAVASVSTRYEAALEKQKKNEEARDADSSQGGLL